MSLLTSAATRRGAFIYRQICCQSFGGSSAIGFVFDLHPFCIGVGRSWFSGESEPAFGRAFQKRFKEVRGDFHGRSFLLSSSFIFSKTIGFWDSNVVGSGWIFCILLNLIPDCFIAAHTLGIHRGQNWHAAVHIIINDDLALAVVQTMQAANVLLQRAAPRN